MKPCACVLLICLILCITYIPFTLSNQCPCEHSPIEYDKLQHVRSLSSNASLTVCIQADTITSDLYQLFYDKSVTIGKDVFLMHYKSMDVLLIDRNSDDGVKEQNLHSRCNAFIEFTKETNIKQTVPCPGACVPVPSIVIPSYYLLNTNLHANTSITCSLSYGMLDLDNQRHNYSGSSKADNTDAYRHNSIARLTHHHAKRLIHEIVCRRIMECHESKIWMPLLNSIRSNRKNLDISSLPLAVKRRKITSLVIWIGSKDNLDLVQLQSKSIEGYTKDVISWAATDSTHPCSEGTTKCYQKPTPHLPAPAMNYMSEGWGCAQRRPLRALAHTLLLYDPEFIILLDDDTYLNYKLLQEKYGSYFTGELTKIPVLIGEYIGKTGPMGHLSLGGMLAGGSGYIIGKKALEILTAKEIEYLSITANKAIDVTENNDFRSQSQVYHLSVVKEGINAVQKYCNSSCIMSTLPRSSIVSTPSYGEAVDYRIMQSIKQWDMSIGSKVNEAGNVGSSSSSSSSRRMVLPLSIRLIDFCSNLLANENTCLHSDHSIGRCLIYAASVYPIGFGCHDGRSTTSSSKSALPPHVHLGMCFMTPECSLSEQITCHRYAPSDGSYDPIRMKKDRRYYALYSSMFDGNKTDTY